MLNRRTKNLPTIIGLLTILSLVGCDSKELTGGIGKDVVAPGELDQAINGPFEFDKEWTTIRFEAPLQVNEAERQVFALGLNSSGYKPLGLRDEKDRNQRQEEMREVTPFGSRGWLPETGDGTVIKPEVELITTDGEHVRVGVVSVTQLGRHLSHPISYEFDILADSDEESNAEWGDRFPEDHSYEAVRIRMNEPVRAYFLAWYVIPADPLIQQEQLTEHEQ